MTVSASPITATIFAGTMLNFGGTVWIAATCSGAVAQPASTKRVESANVLSIIG